MENLTVNETGGLQQANLPKPPENPKGLKFTPKYKMIIRRLKFWAECFKCGNSYEIVDDAALDGMRLGHSEKTLIPAVINWMEDTMFDEAWDIVKAQLLPKGLSEMDAAIIFDKIFGRICDPSPDGSSYNFTGDYPCPKCHCPQINYGPTDPPVYKDIELLKVLHFKWDKLNKIDKISLVKRLLDDLEKIKEYSSF